MARLGFYFDSTKCIGCHVCQISCKDKHNLGLGINFRDVKSFESGVYPKAYIYHYSGACNHCAEAKCVTGCPTGAMHFGEDGTVQHDADLCIGCKYCIWNCPYNAPKYLEEKNVVGKCDSCKDLRDAGQNPACVDACLMRCLKFGDLDELKKEYGTDLVSDIAVLPSSTATKPSLLIKPKSCAFDTNYRQVEV
ncbi:MAG: 4Fe-4S dicluster domain-containing protein [Desulfitobacterium sp.]